MQIQGLKKIENFAVNQLSGPDKLKMVWTK